MFWQGNFKMAVANLLQSKWRSAFTMLGIIIGVTSVVTIVSLGEGLKQQISGQINQLGSDVVTVRSGKLVTRKNGGNINGVNLLAFLSTSTLTNDDVEALKTMPEAQAVVPINFVTSSAKGSTGSSDNLFVVGTSPDMADVLHQKVEFGGFFDQDTSDQNMAVIGSSVARQLFGEFNPVGQTIHIQNREFIIHGVLAQTSGGLVSVAETDFNSAVFIPQQAARELTDNHTNILQILVKSKNKNLNATVSDARKTLLKTHKNQEDFTVLKQVELLDIAGSTVNTLTQFISAIGATNRQILSQFLMEGSVLSITGGIIGIITSLIINLLLRIYTSLHPAITIPIMILAVGVSIAVGIIFSVAPALKAARKRPIDALRGE
jgi:putative ABC transport system permease protein